jgi:hypothetical protein
MLVVLEPRLGVRLSLQTLAKRTRNERRGAVESLVARKIALLTLPSLVVTLLTKMAPCNGLDVKRSATRNTYIRRIAGIARKSDSQPLYDLVIHSPSIQSSMVRELRQIEISAVKLTKSANLGSCTAHNNLPSDSLPWRDGNRRLAPASLDLSLFRLGKSRIDRRWLFLQKCRPVVEWHLSGSLVCRERSDSPPRHAAGRRSGG